MSSEDFGVIMVTAVYFAVYYCYLFTQSFHRIYLEQEKVCIFGDLSAGKAMNLFLADQCANARPGKIRGYCDQEISKDPRQV